MPIVRELALAASEADIHFTIDAEEAERLELSLDIIEALVADDALFANGWQGFGLALQAYQKRAVPLCDWVAALARRHNRRLMVRLVKGAYWDSEIKLSQVGGYADYPVFTRKVATDVSYLACAARLLAAEDAIYPAFATHNAYTIGAIKALAGGARVRVPAAPRHGRGRLRGARRGGGRPPDAGAHLRAGRRAQGPARLSRAPPARERRQLLVRQPHGRCRRAGGRAGRPTRWPTSPRSSRKRNPAIPLPADIYPNRRNSAGIDLADPLVREPLLARAGGAGERANGRAAPTALADAGGGEAARDPLAAGRRPRRRPGARRHRRPTST